MWLAELAHARAAQTPDRVAFRFLDRRLSEYERLSYAELDAFARGLAAVLRARTSEEASIALVLPSGPSFVVALYACLYAGRVAVPAPVPSQPGRPAWARTAAIVREVLPELVLGTPASITRLQDALGPSERPSCLALDGRETWTFPSTPALERPAAQASEVALLQFTSGTTRAPRGTVITHGNLHANLRAIAQRFTHTRDSVGLMWLPMHHDMGLVGGVLEPMHSGFEVVWMPADVVVQQPARWLQAIGQHRATTSGGPPFAFRMCVERIGDDRLHTFDLRSWRVAFMGAERIPADLLSAFADRFAGAGFDRRALRPCYGLAECTLMVSAHGSAQAGRALAEGRVGCGRVIDHHELRVVDPVTLRVCPDGVVGEIWLRGPSVAAGYWQRPEDTERAFRAHLDGVGDYLRTGDLGCLRDGELFIQGRLGHRVTVRGRKFAAEDLEATVAQAHPSLLGCSGAAFADYDDESARPTVVHEVARRALREAAWSEVEGAAREAVVREHGIALGAVWLVPPFSLPRTSSGKIMRTQCAVLVRNGGLRRLNGAHAHDVDLSKGVAP